jgi:hypothetical protein
MFSKGLVPLGLKRAMRFGWIPDDVCVDSVIEPMSESADALRG